MIVSIYIAFFQFCWLFFFISFYNIFQADLVEHKKKESFTQIGSADILTTALEKAEHPGRVRGVGAYVGHKLWFHTPKEMTKNEKELYIQRQYLERLERVEEELRILRSAQSGTPSTNQQTFPP